ncbi:hypothetical protein [Microlunatus flavus]|nr:hypothetical protein [Microlunatus flavus]
MTLRLVQISLDVLTAAGPLNYSTRFQAGLNVLAAPNSYGKSTLLQGVIFALGLEGMLSRSTVAPLGPIMTTVADLPDGRRSAVIESAVTLTVANTRGAHLRVRRFVKSDDVQNALIQTWAASSEQELSTAQQVDTFVRQGGAATRELGFHRVFSEFLGWSLPQVPTYGANEVPLYLEALFPLFYVEQKSGWAGVTPRMPTYLGIRDMLRRSVEYVLGLSTLERLRALNALREERVEVRAAWTRIADKIQSEAASRNLRATVSSAVTGVAQRRPTLVEADVDGSWTPLENALERWTSRARDIESTRIITAGERTPRSRAELDEAELAVRRLGARLRSFSEQMSFLQADLDALTSRLAAVEADRRRIQDVQKVRALGSELEVPLLSEDVCPTCLQGLDDRHVSTGHAATLEDTLLLGGAVRTTLIDMRSVAESRLGDFSRARDAIRHELERARSRVRLLRDELVSESAAPSLVEVREQLWLQDQIASGNRMIALIAAGDDELGQLAERYDYIRGRIRELESEPISPQDQHLLSVFNSGFRQQLLEYGLRSLPAAQVSIDANSLVPTDDGVELRFDIAYGMSASDTIRTKWAYYVSLMQTATNSPQGHHLGLLMFDEPAQQQTAKISLVALVRELGKTSQNGGQVIYATSEDPDDLDEFLRGIPHTRLPAAGRHLLSFGRR